MSKKTMKDCIKTTDLETAVERYNTTSANWKTRWWETCMEIFNFCKEKFEKIFYVDPINKIISKIKDVARKISLQKRWCYVIRIFKNDKWLFDKIGTTEQKDPKARWSQIMRKGWRGIEPENLSYEVISLYDCGEIPPEGQESDLRGKLIKKYGNYIPNDRFHAKLDKEYVDAVAAEYGSIVVC